jgi:hypothetical protein
MSTTTNWFTAALLCLLLGSAYHLDGPSDIEAMQATASSADDAAHAARQQARFERAARKACGSDNGAFVALADGAIQCFTHRGAMTITAKVAL